MNNVPSDSAAPTADERRRRRRTWTVVAVAVASVTATVLVLAHLFQFGMPWAMSSTDHNHVHVAEDGTRQHYQVHLPPGHDGSEALPVMMAIHGCGMTGFGWNSMKDATQFNEIADRDEFIVVYPTQRRFESLINCWNSADPGNQVRGEGEPALLAGVARDVVNRYGADPDRVHAAGASSGAGTAVILGATYPDVFATVTSVSGGEYGLNQVDPDDPDAVPPSTTARQAWAQMGDNARAVPMLIFQGGADEIVPDLVAERLVAQWSAVHDFIDDGLLNESLALENETMRVEEHDGRHAYSITRTRTGSGKSVVEYVNVPAMGHAWPGPNGVGAYTDAAGPDASAMAWHFAARHDAQRASVRAPVGEPNPTALPTAGSAHPTGSSSTPRTMSTR